MSSDAIAVALLAGFVLLTIAIDGYADRRDRRRNRENERRSHHRLMHELRRQP